MCCDGSYCESRKGERRVSDRAPNEARALSPPYGWRRRGRARSDARRLSFRLPHVAADPARELRAGWLYRAATNAAISFMRRRKILHVLPLDREMDRSAWRVDEHGAQSVDLQAALARLPAEQTAALL